MPPQKVTEREIAGRYALRTPLGRGGMGVVWHAHDKLLQRDVAVKEIELPQQVDDDDRSIRKRVLREARVTARLNHPNAVTVYDVIEQDERAYIVMELVRGTTLADIVKAEGPLSPERVASIGADVLGALETAHAEGIVHRDVKPGNVMIDDEGRTKLADFGIASVKDDPKITASGLILGSPSFMAPEQAERGSAVPASDLWGLGATMYAAVEGTSPFKGEGAIAILTAVMGDEPRPMERAGFLEPAITRLLDKDPERRPAGRELRRLLENRSTAPASGSIATTEHIDDGPSTAVATSATPTPTPRPVRPAPAPSRTSGDRKPLLLVLALIALAAIAAAAVALWPDGSPRQGAERDRSGRNEGGAAPADPGAEEAAAPADWETYTDESIGYSIDYPAGWSVTYPAEQQVKFTDPASSASMLVEWLSPPSAPTPEAAWESYSKEFASEHEGYNEIGITPTTFQDMDAAEWEFTYLSGGTEMHAVDLGFITTNDTYGMALFYQAAESEWGSSQETFEEMKAGFRPPNG